MAAQTNAIVLCEADNARCMLTTSFTRMYSLLRSKWGDKPPFTVLSTTNNSVMFYRNPHEQAYWREVRRASRAWRQRDAKLVELFSATPEDDPKTTLCKDDLDPNATCLVKTCHAP